MTVIDKYIEDCDIAVQDILYQVRDCIKEVAPDAEEIISYSMPCFKQKQNLIYFAACKKHLGIYPTASPMVAFADELSEYKTSKGSINFAYNKPIPFDLIKRIVLYRLEELELI